MITPGVVGSKLREAFAKETRDSILNTKIHFIPLNLGALNITLSHVLNTTQEDVDIQGYGQYITIPELRRKIAEFIESRHRNRLYLTSLPSDFLEDTSKYLPAVLYFNSSGTSINNIAGVLYPSYTSTYNALFKEFIRHELVPYLKDARYDNANTTFKGKGFTKGFDIGHVFAQNIASTPVFESINNVIAEIDNQLGSNPRGLLALKQQVLRERYKLKSQSHYGIKVSGTLTKEVKDFLVSISANVVVIQDRLENQYEYGSKIESVVSRAILNILAKVKFSPSISDEITTKILLSLLGKKPSNTKRKAKVPSFEIKDKVSTNIAITSSKNQSYNTTSVKTQLPVASTVNLQALLSAQITSQVRKNMGTGSATNVLNYRSGRFAESVSIERLTTSREGTISVFYNYMRNPYGTFSDNGMQQYPKTRDPKTLISKSIREIGASAMYNRMRAVLV